MKYRPVRQVKKSEVKCFRGLKGCIPVAYKAYQDNQFQCGGIDLTPEIPK